MWGCRGVAVVEERQQLRSGSDICCGEEEDAMPSNRSCSSRGIQVTPENIELTYPLRPAWEDSCQGDHAHTASRSVDAPSRTHVDVRDTASNGSDSGKIAWGWRRVEQAFPDAARGRSSSASGGCGSPNRLLRGRRGNKDINSRDSTKCTTSGVTCATVTTTIGTSQAPTAKTTTMAAVVAPQLIKRVPPRRFVLLRDNSHPLDPASPPAAGAPAVACHIPAGDSAMTMTSRALATIKSDTPAALSASHLPSLTSTKPERLVAELLLRNNGEGLVHGDPASPATSVASDSAPSWAERTGLVRGASVASRAPIFCSANPSWQNDAVAELKGNRDVPRFLRPVLMLLMLSLLAIVGTRVVRGIGVFGPAVHAAGGVRVQEAVVDDIFERADKDNDGVIAHEEIQHLVEGAGGTLLDDASEIKAGVASVIKHLDFNEDHTLSRSDLLAYWKRLGTLLTVDEVAQWVVHAAQLPKEVADTFRSNTVTGYDFPELAANQGALLEQDLGITRPAHRKVLVRSMKWKLWGMGEEPAAPSELRAANASCGVVRLEWDLSDSEGNLSFPVHKSVVRRALLGKEGEGVGKWETVMDGSERIFFDVTVRPGSSYRYHLEVWNALGHSSPVETDVIIAIEDCAFLPPWWGWLLPGGAHETIGAPIAALLVAVTIAAALFPRGLIGAKKMKGGLTEGRFKTAGNGDRPRVRPEPLTPQEVASHDGVGINGSPMSASSGGGGWPDREKRSSTSSSLLSLSNSGCHGPSRERLIRSGSEVVPGSSRGAGSGRLMPPSSLGNSCRTREPTRTEGLNADTVGSIRKKALKRLMSKRSSSQDKEVCRVCHREWRWLQLKHTCCACHRQFCDRRECGEPTHSFWACPVGGTCVCSKCLH